MAWFSRAVFIVLNACSQIAVGGMHQILLCFPCLRLYQMEFSAAIVWRISSVALSICCDPAREKYLYILSLVLFCLDINLRGWGFLMSTLLAAIRLNHFILFLWALKMAKRDNLRRQKVCCLRKRHTLQIGGNVLAEVVPPSLLWSIFDAFIASGCGLVSY